MEQAFHKEDQTVTRTEDIVDSLVTNHKHVLWIGKVDMEVPCPPDTSPNMCRLKTLQNLVLFQDSPA